MNQTKRGDWKRNYGRRKYREMEYASTENTSSTNTYLSAETIIQLASVIKLTFYGTQRHAKSEQAIKSGKIRTVAQLIVKPDSSRYGTSTHRTMRISGNECVWIHCWQKVACPHGNKATVTRGAFKQTSHDADAGAVTTVAVAVVLLLVVIGDCVLSVTSSQSYSSVELPVSTSRLNDRVTLSQQWLTEHKLCYYV